MLTDVEIAQAAKMKKIGEIADSLGIGEDDLIPYGHYMGKIDMKLLDELKDRPDGKLVLVSAITPTPAGEGKTTMNIGLSMALNRLGKKAICTLREPSLGPSFGIKGGAAGGGYSQVVPMENINLHFTGDFHAITSANNLIAALLDNSIQQGNPLNIDPRRVVWKRCLDMNDRALRNIVIGLGGKPDGMPRQDGFDITVASEIMAIFCLASDLQDFKERVGRILVAYSYDNEPIYVKDLDAQGAVALLMKDAINPNLVQTLENTPAIIHGGPFANIAHGCNSVTALRMALKLADYTVTEAGFGADLGAEKFFDITARYGGFKPDACVLVATCRALKHHGGVDKDHYNEENVEALAKGIANLDKHIENIRKFGLNPVVAINMFPSDTDKEVQFIIDHCKEQGVVAVPAREFAEGGKGAEDLAQEVINEVEKNESNYHPLYDLDLGIEEKIELIAKEIYGADDVDFTASAKKAIRRFNKYGYDKLPICMAKTQYSFSDDKNLFGRPEGFRITVRDLRASLGAGFLVALTGDIMTMPGLPKVPAANKMDIDENGTIVGLF